jgi:NADH:ubiquinone oxidoreductase subunit F (NADH-binding)/(2Fe-2S) ferredoxin
MKAHELEILKQQNKNRVTPPAPMILVGMGTCGIGNGADLVFNRIQKYIAENKAACQLKKTGCFGFCAEEPLVTLYQPGKPMLVYSKVEEKDAVHIIDGLLKGKIYRKKILCRIDEWDFHTTKVYFGKGYDDIPHWNEIPFFKGQKKIVLRDAGLIDPEEILDYIAVGGYKAFAKALTEMQPEGVVKEIMDAKLRGRGGAGFPTGIKWDIMRKAEADQKYIICNADEGDPGAFMDRSILEGDPCSVLESMTIAGYAVGADKGYIYIRAEYPLAIHRLQIAISQSREIGMLGKNILGSGFNFDIELKFGAGAFVCGEETALIRSIEGKRGEPTTKPPFPAESGVWEKPTCVNNVETYANIPPIILKGAQWYSSIGTEKSKGTKVFALAGKINNVGLVEVPMGTTLREIIFDIGGGIRGGKEFKSVQTGGPSGGCITKENLDTPITYENLTAIGSMMGSGGMIVMDETDCMVNVAKFYLEFTLDESCGKCTPCRVGNKRLHELLTTITEGKAEPNTMEKLEALANTIKKTSLCGLGQTSPNPVLSTMRFFKNEYLDHINNHKCTAGVCKNLMSYFILEDKCIGCTACARNCPVGCITGKVKQPHTIDQEKCIKCGACYQKCKFSAIEIR